MSLQQYDLDYNQARAWITPQLHTLFLQVFPGLRNQLPLELMLLIASFVVNSAQAATSVMTQENTSTFFKRHQKVMPQLLRDAAGAAKDNAADERLKRRTKF